MEECVGKESVLILVTQHVKLNNCIANTYLTSTILLSSRNALKYGMLSDH